MTQLTPYDTGQRAEPKPWVTSTQGVGGTNDRDDWGKVDFDGDSGETVATIWLERDETTGDYVVRIEDHHPLRVTVVWDA